MWSCYTDHLLSLSLSLTEGSRQIASEKETASLCYPTGSIHVLLTQEWMTRVNNSKVRPVSSLTICQVYCGHDASWRAEAEMDPQSGSYCARWRLKHKIRGLIYRKLVQQIWLKKRPHLCQVFSLFDDLEKGLSSSAELSLMRTALK